MSNTASHEQHEPPTSEAEIIDDDAADDEKIDEAGRESFPASDPPAY